MQAEHYKGRCGSCGSTRKCVELWNKWGHASLYCLKECSADAQRTHTIARPSDEAILRVLRQEALTAARARLRSGIPLTAAQQALLDED